MNILKKAILGTALGATALTATASPALARRGYYHHHDGDATGAAIGAGILGIAIGAIVASSANDHRYDDRYYEGRSSAPPVYQGGFYYRDGYYWDRDGRRYDRDEWRRYQRGYDYRSGYDRDPGYYRRGY